MPERRSLTFKIPSEKLALIQNSMDGVKKRKKRVCWKAAEKEAMFALRGQHPNMSMKEFQQTFYPDRSVTNLRKTISKMRQAPGKEEEGETGNEDLRGVSTPETIKLRRPQKRPPFEFSDNEDEDSNPDERIEDINPSGLRTPNKGLQFIKLSHPAEAQSPLARHAVEKREPIVRSHTYEAPQLPNESTALSSRPQTVPPETTTVVQETICADSSSSSTGMSPILLDISLDRPAECPVTEMQVVIQDEQQQQPQLQPPKQEVFPESLIMKEFAKKATDMYAGLQSMCRLNEQLFSVANQARVQHSVRERECDIMKENCNLMKKEIETMKIKRNMEIAQLKETWQAERDSLVQRNDSLVEENAIMEKKFEIMKDVFEGNIVGKFKE